MRVGHEDDGGREEKGVVFGPSFGPRRRKVFKYVLGGSYKSTSAGATAMAELLTNLAHPKSSATITVRVIKSFEYRTEKSLVLHNVNLLETTVAQLKQRVLDGTADQLSQSPSLLSIPQLYVHRAHGNPIALPSSVSDIRKNTPLDVV